MKLTQEQQKQVEQLQDHFKDADDPSQLVEHLRTWVEPGSGDFVKFMIRHPLYYHVVGPLLPHQANLNLKYKFEEFKRLWREQRWNSLLFLIERPYRLSYLRRLYERDTITYDEMTELLLYWWTDTELPQSSQDDAIILFQQIGFMTDDQEGWDAMPDELELWRGVDGKFEMTKDGPAWSTNRKVAEFFARRYEGGQDLYRIVIQKEEATAWITGRDESEVILDFTQIDEGRIEHVNA